MLVRPQDSKNIGSVARAMKTLGFSKLVLIAPEHYEVKSAEVTACHSEDILARAQQASSLDEALSDYQEVVGFSGRTGRDRLEHKMLPEWVNEVSKINGPKVALVFGNERTGLLRDELALCRHVIAIPTVNSQPSYNLSQAVLLVLYQLRYGSADTTEPIQDFEAASWEQYTQLSSVADKLGQHSGFFRSGSSAVVRELFPKILRRVQLSVRECDILIGYCSKLLGKLERSAADDSTK